MSYHFGGAYPARRTWIGWRLNWPAIFPVTVRRIPPRTPVLYLPFDLDESDLDIAA